MHALTLAPHLYFFGMVLFAAGFGFFMGRDWSESKARDIRQDALTEGRAEVLREMAGDTPTEERGTHRLN